MDNQQHLDALPGFPVADLEDPSYEFLLHSSNEDLESYINETLDANLFLEFDKDTDSGEVILYSGSFPDDDEITLFTDAHGEHDNVVNKTPTPPSSPYLESYINETLDVNLFPETVKDTDLEEVILYSGLFPDVENTLFTDAHGEHDNVVNKTPTPPTPPSSP